GVMKRHEKDNKQISTASATRAVMTAKTPDTVKKQFSPPHKQTFPALAPLQERTISSPPIITKKETVIERQQTTQVLPHVPKPATLTLRKSPLMKLGLKP